jgi:PilZ domain
MHIAPETGTIPNLSDRRNHPRHETCWWGDLTIRSLQRECYVYNVSLGGAKLLVVGAYEPADRVTLLLPSFGMFHCSMRWKDGPFIGIKFDGSDHERAATLVAHALTGLPLSALPSVAEFIGV